MKRNKLSLFLVTLASGLLLCQNAGAYATWTDEFVNYATGRLGDAGTGATGGNPGWGSARDQITVTNGSGSLDGTSLGLVVSYGDKVSISGWSNTNSIGGVTYNMFVPKGTYPPTVATNIYYSFLYRFNTITDVPTFGFPIIAVNNQNSGVISSPSTVHWQLQAKRTGSTVQLGINKYAGVTNYAAASLTAGQTFFVVVRQQILPTPTNDIVDLWINPPAGSFGTNELDVPAANATVSDVADATSTTGPGRFNLYPTWWAADLDEVRVANNWADVTPWFGQCVGASIYLSPSNVTQVEGIGASFSVGVIASGPTYQWQLSQDGGTTWNNISGALQSIYSTPNLWIASDNGNKYRAIIYVACNSSYTTSAVATATVTAPVSTPTGVIMDDNFNWETDGQRGALPVTTTHSVWFTAPPSENLTDYPGPDMIGTPLTGSSSLYLGYFVNEANGTNGISAVTNLPVHLDVNRAIKVTLLFTPVGAHTNNGPLRFGLFDYADGGVLLTNDSSLASGSAGNGRNVRGYMLSVDFGTTFTANSPLSLSARFGLADNNLMGTTSDYISMGSGPSGGGYTNAPAFQAGTLYTLVFQVTRIAVSSVRVTATITNAAGTNWTYSSIETNYAYHRFDAFGIRPNSLETSANTFTFPEFKVEVIEVAAEITGINITGISRTGNSVTLTWSPTPAGSFTYSVQRKLDLLDPTWTTLQTGITTTTYTDTGATSSNGFYRVVSP